MKMIKVGTGTRVLNIKKINHFLCKFTFDQISILGKLESQAFPNDIKTKSSLL